MANTTIFPPRGHLAGVSTKIYSQQHQKLRSQGVKRFQRFLKFIADSQSDVSIEK